jgi:uncharacterized BrkB/YihY/UPF0761 family membrane protein
MADAGADQGRGGTSHPAGSLRSRAEQWVRVRHDQLEAARETSTTVGIAFDAVSYDSSTGAPVLAAALGFRVFLFQVPYAFLFVIVSGVLSDLTGHDISTYFHGRGIGKLTAAAVSSAANLSGWALATGVVLASYALFLSARSLVKVLYIAHALVWGVPPTRVPRANRAALSLIGMLAALVALSLVIAVLGGTALSGLTLLILYTGAFFAVWWRVTAWLPHRGPPIALLPGAALFAIGVEVLQVVTVIWFPHYIQSKSAVYGAIGVALVLLLWAYLLGRLITLAAVLNAALWARFGPASPHPLHVERPPLHLPLVDDRLARIWAAVWGPLATGSPRPGAEAGTGVPTAPAEPANGGPPGGADGAPGPGHRGPVDGTGDEPPR